jgi:ABC-2 type transport system ATP-binding protein
MNILDTLEPPCPPDDAAAAAPVVRLDGVTRRFGKKTALENVSLAIPTGSVLGLVGENGAGKTTLIKHVLGLLRPDRGTVRVFGRDPVADPVGVLSSIGYLSEDADLPGWMRVHELMCYCQAFYPTWDERYAGELRREFALDAAAPIKHLSKGQRARAGLLVALAYRPDLLVLDEPSSGLDPVVRKDILAAIIRTIADEGRTVLFSSHLLSEVERVSDRVAMIRAGRILFCDTVEEIREGHCRVTLRFERPRPAPPRLEGALTWEGSGREWTAFCRAGMAQVEALAAVIGARVVDRACPTLDEIFMAHSAFPDGAGEAR